MTPERLTKLRKVSKPLLVFIVGGIIAGGALLFMNLRAQDESRELMIKTGTASYTVEVVSTSREQQKGLSNRVNLPRDKGMLFEFDRSEEQCFWMKDMQFSIDIIWADESRRVTRIEGDVSPKTYPQSYCAEAKYVIELNAGEAAKNGLKPGDRLDF